MSKFIDEIVLPEGLRDLKTKELEIVASELRDELIDCVSSSGGHFASSLGATEITVALHHLFRTPHDRLVWDVGHQGYIHKMLTGRRDRMNSIRKKDGISGFLKREESEFDCFGAGHAGTSISAALGMAYAAQASGEERFVVAVIGDGSMTAGMAFEALNHAGACGIKNFIVVLNDNEMSISPNVGAVSWLLSKALTSKTSTLARSGFKRLYQKGYVPELVYRAIDKAEEAAQGFFASPAMLFEAFGFRYIGPVDGHNIDELVQALSNAKTQDVPVLVHARTQKGKGYEPAEEDPIKWHGVNPFDRSKGEFVATKPVAIKAPTYTAVFAETLLELAKDDEKIIGITAAMPGGTGLDLVQKDLPRAAIDVGICEQHAVTFAAGLACEGYKPVVAIYSTFLQRAYDQIIHDVCIQNLPVTFALDRAGVVGNDGETHQGVFDIAFLRTIPNITIMSPKDEDELRHMLFSSLKVEGPVAIRYPRGNGVGVEQKEELSFIDKGKSEVLYHGSRVLILAFGPVVQTGIWVREQLLADGINPTLVNARFAKPLDEELLAALLPAHDLIVTLEDHAIIGGFGSAVVEFASDRGIVSNITRFGVPDYFIPHGSQVEQQAMAGYSPAAVLSFIRKNLQKKQFALTA